MQVCHTYHCGTCPRTGTSESDSIGTCFGFSFGSYSGVHTYHTPVWGEWSDGRNPTKWEKQKSSLILRKTPNYTFLFTHIACFKCLSCSVHVKDLYTLLKRDRKLCTQSKPGASPNRLAGHSKVVFVLICPWIRRGFLSWKHSFCLPGIVTEIQNRNEVDNSTQEDHILNVRGEQYDHGKGK